MTDRLILRRPDDMHLHLRDGAMLAGVLPESARHFARAIVMPNLVPPVVTAAQAAAYRDRILAALPEGMTFEPLMTLYLTEGTDPDDVARAHASGLVKAVKLYPAGATTNSQSGVRDFDQVRGVLERMAEIGLPLCVHGEVTDPEVDIFDREAVFIDRVLDPIRRRTPGLRVVMEHITTAEGVAYARAGGCRPRRHDHHASPRHQPQPHPRRRHPAALLLPAGGQARNAPARAAAGRDQRRGALLPRHRQRAACRRAQGTCLRLRGLLHRDQHAVDPRAGVRGGGRAGPARGLHQPERRRLLPPAAERGHA